MSSESAGDDVRAEAAPIPPPITPHPLAPFKRLLVPGIVTVVIVCGVVYGLIPLWNTMRTANRNYEKFRQEAVRSYSNTYRVPLPPPPVYYPGNSPSGLVPRFNR
jgi:hypothetical protein